MEIRPITDDEVPAYRRCIMATFAGDPAQDPDGDERQRALIHPGRAYAAFDRGTVVATAGTFEQTVSLPGGGELAMAGLTMVTVRPTHRRRGILRGLIDLHLADARDHGEPVSGLWASEAAIYKRFGYGIAAEGDELTIAASGLEVAAGLPLDDVEDLDDAAVASLLPPVYEAVRDARAGMISRSPAWWSWRRLRERPDMRHGASPRRHVVARRAGAVTGWVASRQKLGWGDGGVPDGVFEIDELIAIDARAEATLWRYVTSVDLFPKVTWTNAPLDAALPWLSSDPRRAQRLRCDTLWVRPDDIAVSLAARRYAGDGRLRLAITEPGAPTYALEVERGVARCAATDRAPELYLDRAALGTLLLGGYPASLLARAGRIAGDAATLALADRLFVWPTPPWCAEMF